MKKIVHTPDPSDPAGSVMAYVSEVVTKKANGNGRRI